jgi:hypothetical protein
MAEAARFERSLPVDQRLPQHANGKSIVAIRVIRITFSCGCIRYLCKKQEGYGERIKSPWLFVNCIIEPLSPMQGGKDI